MLSHPFGTRQMAFERPAGAIRFVIRIKIQHQTCDFTPVSTFRFRVQQAQIRDDVLLVVNGQYGIGGRSIGDKRRLLHGLSRKVVDRSILRWAMAYSSPKSALLL